MPGAGMDFCGRCSRRVHNLDGMSDVQREALLANCSGEVCVAYSVRHSFGLAGAVGLGVAAVLGMKGAVAQDVLPIEALGSDAAAARDSIPTIVTGPTCDPNANGAGLESIFVGGVKFARDARWIDEREAGLPDAPSISEIDATAWLPTPQADKPAPR